MNILSAISLLALCLASMLPKSAAAQSEGPNENAAHSGNGAPSQAQQATGSAADLDLEQLANMDVKVTSVTKSSASLFTAPAAIFVLTEEDIRRGGFTTLPEALRMVPGLYVARLNSHSWEISARGFSGLDNNKMLVLVDGVNMQTLLFGGVYWDMMDIPLEDIERVEIIRGPGGTLWGAGAVNGVINIVTKSSHDTQGAMVSVSGDVDEGYTATVQYGGAVGNNLTYRVFGRASYWEPLESSTGSTVPDSFAVPQMGARVDWQLSPKDLLTFSGTAEDGRYNTLNPFFLTAEDTDVLKANTLQLNWQRSISERSRMGVIGYCSWFDRTDAKGEKRNTCEAEFQHSYTLTQRQSIIWGGGFYTTGDDLSVSPLFQNRPTRRVNTTSGWGQYEAIVVPDRFRIHPAGYKARAQWILRIRIPTPGSRRMDAAQEPDDLGRLLARGGYTHARV